MMDTLDKLVPDVLEQENVCRNGRNPTKIDIADLQRKVDTHEILINAVQTDLTRIRTHTVERLHNRLNEVRSEYLSAVLDIKDAQEQSRLQLKELTEATLAGRQNQLDQSQQLIEQYSQMAKLRQEIEKQQKALEADIERHRKNEPRYLRWFFASTVAAITALATLFAALVSEQVYGALSAGFGRLLQ